MLKRVVLPERRGRRRRWTGMSWCRKSWRAGLLSTNIPLPAKWAKSDDDESVGVVPTRGFCWLNSEENDLEAEECWCWEAWQAKECLNTNRCQEERNWPRISISRTFKFGIWQVWAKGSGIRCPPILKTPQSIITLELEFYFCRDGKLDKVHVFGKCENECQVIQRKETDDRCGIYFMQPC